MRRKIGHLILSCLIFTSGSVLAQDKSESPKPPKFKVSFEAGVTNSNRDVNLDNQVDSYYDPRTGFGATVTGEYNFFKYFTASLGVSFQNKNYKFQRTETYSNWHTNYNTSYINMPLLVGGYLFNNPYKIQKGFWMKVAGGIYGEHFLSLNTKGTYPTFNGLQNDGSYTLQSVNEKYDFGTNMNHFSRWGLGLQGQVQAGYTLKKLDMYASFNYQKGLSDVTTYNRDKNNKDRMLSYMISLGVAYKF